MQRSFLRVLLSTLLICTASTGIAAADDVLISGTVAFSSIDGSSEDHDGAANGVFTVDDGNLVIDGTIQCNDGPPLPGNAGACPIRISVSGDLVLEAGGAIVAENRIGGGSGANIDLEVGGDLILHGPSGALPGAVVSSGSITGSGAAGSISASIDGAVDLEAGSTLSASAAGGSAGAVGIEAGSGIRIAGLVASGPGTSLLASRWNGAVLGGGSAGQSGGTILLRSTSADEPGILIEATGTVASQGQSSGAQLVQLEACGIEVHGLVAAVSKTDSPARVALRSGKGILVDGTDLAAGAGSHLGRVRADSIEGGAATHLVDLFADADIQILGPTSGTTDLFAVSANPGTQGQRTGGSISSVSLAGALAASGNAFDAGRALSGNKGGKIDLRSAGDVDLADAHLRAVGGYLAASGSRRGGQISVRSYSGEIRWTFGTGDVRPTGSGTTAGSRGTMKLTACSGIDTTGTTFPVLGSPVAPFPVEADGVCSPAAPSLPSGEPPLLVCSVPPVAVDDSYAAEKDTTLNINAAAGVTSNDTLNGGSIVSYGATGGEQATIGAATPTSAGGSIALNADGSFIYTPPAGAVGIDDTFKYVLQNSSGTSTATVTIAVGKASQTISFTSTAPSGATVGGPTYTVTATATSGLPVTFTIDATASSVCSIAGSTVSFIGVGTCVINADQAGDANYNPAPQVQQSFTVGKGDQTITFTSTAPADAKVGGPAYSVTATASSTLTVAFTIDATATSVCSIAGSTVSFIGVGTCVINANQAGDANYNPAPQVQQSFPVVKQDQTITFTSAAPVGATVGGPTYMVTATATSGLPVTFTIDGSAASVCTIAGSTVSFIGAGTCVINANQAGDATYNAAPQVQQSFPVAKQDQTITFTSAAPADAKVAGPTYTVTATATSGLPVAFTIDASAASVCTIAGSTVSFIGAGTCVINANQAGNGAYNPAPQVQQSFLVTKQDQTITFTSTPPALATIGGPTYTVTATATSGLPVTFTIDASAASVCTVAGSTVSFIGGGTCVINANQAGNTTYNPAPQVQQSFPVNFPPQLVAAPKETFDTIGNTGFEFKAAQILSPSVFVAGNLKDNFTDSDGPSPLSVQRVVGCPDLVSPYDCPTANGGMVSLADNGQFTFTPKAGDTAASDSFTYSITDGAYVIDRSVTLNRKERVWYVKNDDPLEAPASDDGTSADPFNTLAAAQTASSPNDYIFVYYGDGTTTNQSSGIALKNGQHLIGQFAGLTITFNPAITFNGVAGTTSVTLLTPPDLTFCSGNPCRPLLDDTVAGGPEGVGAVDVVPAEIIGLNLAGNVNAIDWNTAAAVSGTGTLTIRDNIVRSAGADGVDINLAGTGAVNLAFYNNNLTAAGAGLDIQETGTGSLTITAFNNNAVGGNTGGTGININTATFDATPGGSFNTVSGGVTVIGGAGGNGVGQSGLVLTNVQGDLNFGNLNIFADNGAGLQASSAAAYTGSAGLRMVVGAGVGIIEATGGPAVNINTATIDLQLSSLKSTSTSSTGVSLVNVSDGGATNAVFSAGSGSSITTTAGASGPAFNVSGGNAKITFGGTITNNGTGRAVSIATWNGDDAGDDILLSGAIDENGAGILLNGNGGSRSITFSGGMDIDTTTGEGFAATSNTNTGGLHITGTNTIDTTIATALRVTSTPIGNSGLTFRSISSGTAGSDSSAVGIVLDNTGTAAGNGSLTVTGTGSANSGGTIQRKTGGDGSTAAGIGIYLNNTKNPSFSWMLLRDFQNYAIRGIAVSGFTLANSTVEVAAYSSNGTSAASDEGSISFGSRAPSSQTGLTGTASITNSTIRRGFEDSISVFNWSGVLDLTIDNCVIRDTTGNDGVVIEAHSNADIGVDVKNSDLISNVGDHFQATADDTAVLDVKFGTNGGNILTGGAPGAVGQSVVINSGAFAGTVTFDVSNNSINGAIDTPINVNKGGGTGTFSGRIKNNTIGTTGVANSGTTGNKDAIRAVTNGAGSYTAEISGNTIRQVSGNGIFAIARDGVGGDLDLTITGNTLSEPNPGVNAIRVESGATGTDDLDVCADIGGATVALRNTVNGDWGAAIAADEMRMRHQFSALCTFRMPGLSGGTTTDVVNHLTGRNSGFPPATASATIGGGGSYGGGGACVQPSN